MEKLDLTKALKNSISSEVSANATNLLEIGIDALMDDGILKEIPVVSAVVGVYKIGHSIRELHYIKKLTAFVLALNNGTASEKDKEYYQNALTESDNSRAKEIEHILLLLDRYLHLDQSEMLASLYLAYLREYITWDEFAKYSEIIGRFLPGDSVFLKKEASYTVRSSTQEDSLIRLASLGLYYQVVDDIMIKMRWGQDTSGSTYYRSKMGQKLCSIIFPDFHKTMAERKKTEQK